MGLRNSLQVFVYVVFLNHFRYLCKLSDQELRQSAARNMADLMWSTVKEPLDTTLCFDKESLDLAFKYFMSPTLTMRLAGLSQITVSYFCFIFGNFLFAFSGYHYNHHNTYCLWSHLCHARHCAKDFRYITLYGPYKSFLCVVFSHILNVKRQGLRRIYTLGLSDFQVQLLQFCIYVYIYLFIFGKFSPFFFKKNIYYYLFHCARS